MEVQRRVAYWLHERELEAGHGVAVTHGAVIRAAITHIIGAPLNSFWRIDVEPLRYTDLRRNGSLWTMCSMGCHTFG
jgi:broad specificity phosphatase PhoE